MAKIAKGEVLLSHGTQLVTAVHDNFGLTLRGLNTMHGSGEILTRKLNHRGLSGDTGPIDGDDTSTCNFRILRPVHVNTVKALQRKIGDSRQLCAGLRWYEVHGD